jgi:Antitoxin SocA-like, Panacea domain
MGHSGTAGAALSIFLLRVSIVFYVRLHSMADEKEKATPFIPERKADFPFKFEKFLAAVQYMAGESLPEFDKYKIVKLLFLADKYHLVKFARPITGDRYCALEYGPVGSKSLDLLNWFTDYVRGTPTIDDDRIHQMAAALDLDLKFRYPRFSTRSAPEFSYLSKSDLIALDFAIKKFGHLDFDGLKSITHLMYAYRKTWHENPNGPMDFEDFFEEDSEAIEGARELMIENAEIAEDYPPIGEL